MRAFLCVCANIITMEAFKLFKFFFWLLIFKGSYEMPCIDTVEDVDKFEIQVLAMM